MSLDRDIASLRRAKIFSNFSDEQLRLVAFGGQRLNLPEGMELFHNGQSAESGYLILDGEISVEIYKNPNTPETTKLGPGTLIGEMALLTRNRHVGTARVTADAEVLKIRREVMLRVLQEYPELAASLYQQIAANVVNIGKDLERVEKRLSFPPNT